MQIMSKNKKRLAYAIQVASECHVRQFRSTGMPYIVHPLRVMALLENPTESSQVVAALHDTIEDCFWLKPEDLRQLDWCEKIPDIHNQLTDYEMEALKLLTRKPTDIYDEYITRLSVNKLAVQVKLADLEDHLTCNESDPTTEKYKLKMEKYRKAKEFLLNVKKSWVEVVKPVVAIPSVNPIVAEEVKKIDSAPTSPANDIVIK